MFWKYEDNQELAMTIIILKNQEGCQILTIMKCVLVHNNCLKLIAQVVLPPSSPLLVTTAGRPLDTETLTEVE